jgi:hypothetical protein
LAANEEQPPRLSPEEFALDRKIHLEGRLLRAKDLGGKGYLFWRCEKVTLLPQTGYPKLLFLMRQRLEKVIGERFHEGGAKVGDVEYRLGYYTVARNGKWWFGQYAMMVPPRDFEALLERAREEGTLLPA